MSKCPECLLPVSAGSIKLTHENGSTWEYHQKCFFCKKCGNGLSAATFRKIDKKFYCPECVDKNPDFYLKWKQQNPEQAAAVAKTKDSKAKK